MPGVSHYPGGLILYLIRSRDSVADDRVELPPGEDLVVDERLLLAVEQDGDGVALVDVPDDKVARWQNLIPSFPWIVPGRRACGAILPSGTLVVRNVYEGYSVSILFDGEEQPLVYHEVLARGELDTVISDAVPASNQVISNYMYGLYRIL